MGRPTRPYCGTAHEQSAHDQYPANRVLRFLVRCKRRFNDLDAIAIFTLMLVFVTAFQAWSFVVTQRAFLYPSSIDFAYGPQPIPGKHLDFIIRILNNGHTTAFVLDGAVGGFLSDNGTDPLPMHPAYSGRHLKGMAIPAGATHQWMSFVAQNQKGESITITQDLADKLTHGSRRLYVYGFVTYRDGFGFNLLKHTTGFCSFYNPSSIPVTGMWSHCDSDRYEYAN